MSDSIKKQIMARVLADLEPLKTAGTFRVIERRLDPLAVSGIVPACFIYDGDEVPIERDDYGRTYQFPIAIKILIETHRNLGDAKDDVVALVQQAIENDLQLGGLVDWIDDGSEQPFLNELGKPDGGALVTWLVQYRRKLGNPFATY